MLTNIKYFKGNAPSCDPLKISKQRWRNAVKTLVMDGWKADRSTAAKRSDWFIKLKSSVYARIFSLLILLFTLFFLPCTGESMDTYSDLEIETSIQKAVNYLSSVQHNEGYWAGSFDTDTSFTADYIILMHYLGKVDTRRQGKAVHYILSQQNSDGGWSAYPHGPSYLNIAVTNYCALKLAGMSASDPRILKAKNFILSQGGAEKANLLVKIKLSLFGQCPWLAQIPVNVDYLFADEALYRLGYLHTAIAPILVLHDNYYKVKISGDRGVREIFLKDPWRGVIELRPLKGLLQPYAIKWMLQRQEADGNWAGVFVNTMLNLLALKSTQNSTYNAVIEKGMEGVRLFQNETDTMLAQQFSQPPVMDTAYVVHALLSAGVDPYSPVITDAIGYLRSKQSLIYGDWHHNNPKGEPGGWGFEHHNQWYPDVDCTVMVLDALALFDILTQKPFDQDEAIQRGMNWAVSMQDLDGGWAAWDKNPVKPPAWVIQLLNQSWIPWDESNEDITSRSLLALSNLGYHDPAVIQPALNFIKKRQKANGSWYGRWGVNYTYGTGQILQGLMATGENPQDAYIRNAVAWLDKVQNADGGWGESLESYAKGAYVAAPSTVFQSAYALIGLISAGEANTPEVEKGISFLVDSQLPDGSWYDEEFLGTGFPGHLYSRYTLLSTYKVLYALTLYLNNR